MINTLFPKSHILLRARQFQELEQTLAEAQEVSASNEFDRHIYLLEIANCGAKLYPLLEEWVQAMPDSKYAHTVLAEYWSFHVERFRGGDVRVPEAGGLAAAAAADLSARWALAGLSQSADVVFTASQLCSLERFVGMPAWFYGAPPPQEALWNLETLRKLAAAGYSKAPPIPQVPWEQSDTPSEWLLNLAWSKRPDAYLAAKTEMHFSRPRWFGSTETMYALLASKRFQGLSQGHRELLQVWVDTDEVDGFTPENASFSTHTIILKAFDRAYDRVSHPRARAECLLIKSDYLDQQEDMEGAASCIREAMDVDPTLIWELADRAEVMFMDKADDPYTLKACHAGLLAGDQPAMAGLYMIYQNGIGTDPNPELAAQIVEHAANTAIDCPNWADFCNEYGYVNKAWSLDALEAGARAGLVDCWGQLARAYFNFQSPEDDLRAEAYARKGLVQNEPMARYVMAQVRMQRATSQEDRLAIIQDLVELGETDEDSLRLAIKYAARYHLEPDAQMHLVNTALEKGYDWAEGQMAFHLCFGIGTPKDKALASEYATAALSWDEGDRLARLVKRAITLPFLYWFHTPNKARLMVF